ncbi:MAG: hypothetical protein ACM33B_07230 [Pseudomonadota bacterium]
MSDLAFAILLLLAGVAFVVYAGPLGERAQARGARYGRELYYLAAAFLLAFGLTELVHVLA